METQFVLAQKAKTIGEKWRSFFTVVDRLCSSMVRWTVLQMTIDIFQLLEPKLLGLFIFDAAPVSTRHGCGCGIRIRSSQTDFGYLDHNLLGMSGQIQEIM